MSADIDTLEAQVRCLENENRELRETLRDRFAMQAMASLIAARATLDDDDDESFASAAVCGVGYVFSNHVDKLNNPVTWSSSLASDAYYIADQMLEARK